MQLNYIIKKSRRRSISISVMTDNRVLVKAPYGTQERTVQEFLLSKKEWIKKQIEKQNQEAGKAEALGFLSEDEIKQIKKQARKIIPQRVGYWAERLGVTYGRIAIRLQSSRWGSCAQNGNLNFNCLLVLMPCEVLDSVVVHELCHRKHMNHSKEFYAEIDRVFPDYKSCNKWLKENGGVYMKRASCYNKKKLEE
jgi:hypothetical protein